MRVNAPVLFLGRADRSEWSDLLTQLRATISVQVVPDVSAAIDRVERDPPVQRILVAPSFRGEFPQAQLQRLAASAPLAQIALLVGPWIEGETRSGRPVPGVERIYLHRVLPATQPATVRAINRGLVQAAWHPATVSNDEIWQQAADEPWPSCDGLAVVCSELAETQRALVDVCTAAGMRAVGHRPGDEPLINGVDAVIYDAVGDRSHWEDHLRQLVRRYRPTTSLALVNFPRPDEARRLRQAGATGVLGKPYRLTDLLAHLAAG